MDRILEIIFDVFIEAVEEGRKMRDVEWVRVKASLQNRRKDIVAEMKAIKADLPEVGDGKPDS